MSIYTKHASNHLATTSQPLEDIQNILENILNGIVSHENHSQRPSNHLATPREI